MKVHGMDLKGYLQIAIAALEKDRGEIQAGRRIATTDELIFGLPFNRGDLQCDAQLWYRYGQQESFKAADPTGRLARLIEALCEYPSASRAIAAIDLAAELQEETEDPRESEELRAIALRLDFYAAELGHRDAAARMVVACLSRATASHVNAIRRAEALVSARYFADLAKHLSIATVDDERIVARRRQARDRAGRSISETVETFKLAVDATAEWELQRAVADVAAEATKPAEDDLPGVATEFPKEEKPEARSFFASPSASLRGQVARFREEHDFQPPGIKVVGSLAHLPRDSKGDTSIRTQFKALEGRHIPLVGCTEPAGVYADISERYPWAERAISSMIKEVGRRPIVRLRPTLLVGPPGSGKTKLAMELATALGLRPTKFSCAGVADASFAGTSRQWGSARASVLLQAIQRSMIANPTIVLDEIEKTATEKRNGSLLDSLLDFLERDNAARVFDPALECPIDLSGVVYIATANSLAGLPAAIADRFRRQLLSSRRGLRSLLLFILAAVLASCLQVDPGLLVLLSTILSGSRSMLVVARFGAGQSHFGVAKDAT